MSSVTVGQGPGALTQGFMLVISMFSVCWQTSGQPVPGGVCRPVAERTSEVGCWIVANDRIGVIAERETFWHLYTYPTLAAAKAAEGLHGTVLESFGKVWVLTIERADWHPLTGEKVSVIGPIPTKKGEHYSTQYMEVTFNPGMTASTHRHGGPEAWYTLAGETCLETPDGKVIGRAGGPPVIIRDGPMHLTAIGTEQRRALVLILHESSKPATTLARDWTPKGLCKQ